MPERSCVNRDLPQRFQRFDRKKHSLPRQPGIACLMRDLERLFRAREILYMLTWRDVAIRYKQSIMGLLWAVLLPGLVVVAGVMVRLVIAQYSSSPVTTDDLASIMVRATAWSFFISALRFGTNSLIGNNSLVSKLSFPKEVFPLAAVLAALFDFLIACAVVFLILIIAGWLPGIEALWALPLFLMVVLMATGLSLLLSAANLFFRDVKYLVEIFLTYAIFFTPVLYEASHAGKWREYLLLNPVSPLLEGLADSLVWRRAPDPGWTAYGAIFSLVIAVVGYRVFKRLEARFAESI